MSYQLLQAPALASEINVFLEEGNKFVINEPEGDKIHKLVGYIKQNNREKFQEILAMIQSMSSRRGEDGGPISPEEQNKNIISHLKEIVKGDR